MRQSAPRPLSLAPLLVIVIEIAAAFELYPFNPDIHLDVQLRHGHYPKHPLAIVVLANPDREEKLVTCLQSVAANVTPNNAADLLVFHTGEYSVFERQASLRQKVNLSLLFLPIPYSYWKIPDFVNASEQSRNSWHSLDKGVGYRHMCRWYSHGLFLYLNKAGYKWLLRLDDDSIVQSPITDVVQLMTSNKKVYGFRTWLYDDPSVTYGIAEITRFFIVEEKMTPTWLYKHCKPPNLSGLTSESWNRGYFYSNFYVTEIAFWVQPQVQRYLRLVDASGGYYKFRWGDTIVQTMVAGLFLNEKQLYRFTFEYFHQRPWNACNDTLFQFC